MSTETGNTRQHLALSTSSDSLVKKQYLLITFVLFFFFATVNPSVAHAQSGHQNLPSVTMELLDQTDWVKSGAPFEAKLRIVTSTPLDQLDLVVGVQNAIANRGQFHDVVEEETSLPTVIFERRPLNEIQQADGIFTVSLPVGDAAQRRFYLRDAGVYPVQFELRIGSATGKTVAKLVTFLINTPDTSPPYTPIGVANVLPVTSAINSDANNIDVINDQAKNFNSISQAMLSHRTLPLTFAPEANAIERLQLAQDDQLKQSLQSFRETVANNRVVAGPWSPLANGLYGENFQFSVDSSLQRSNHVLTKTFANVDSATWFPTAATDNSANDFVNRSGYRRAIINEKDLAPVSLATTLARPFSLTTTKAKPALPAGQADAKLASHFGIPGSLGAHRLLADLAVVWSDLPSQQRSLLVSPNADWTPDTTYLDQYFRALSSSPIAVSIDLDKYFATPPATVGRAPMTRKLNSGKPSISQESRIAQNQDHLRALSSMVDGTSKPIDQLTRLHLFSTSARIDNKVRNEWLDAFRTSFDKQISGIHVPPDRSIRLTSDKGEIPISIQNDNGYPMKVRITLSSSKLGFPAGASRLVVVERQQVTERFAIDAKTAGTFPMQVHITSPDGQINLVSSKITVRSTATSRIGIGLTIGALVFLVVWWIDAALKKRSNREQNSKTLPSSSEALLHD